MNEQTQERILDARIQARLRTDRAYLNAENADEQTQRENEIEDAEFARLQHEIGCDSDGMGAA